jgi:glycosyltransferase involved in cell wall biosynthesis
MAARKPRVFIGLREVAGFGRGLKAGFDQLGIDSVFLNIGYNPFEYEVRNNPAWANQLSSASSRLGKHFTGSWLKRILWIGFFQNLFAAPAFLWALWRYDAFIFGSVATFFFFLELPILKLFGKTVIFVFLGSDSRPVYLNGYVMTDAELPTIRKGIKLARLQKLVISIIERFATYLVNIPPQSHYHTRPIVNGYLMGLPAEYSQAEVANPQPGGDVIRILHAPSKPGPKGTVRIREAIASLKAKGHRFEYIEISGRSHAEVLAEIQRCSFVVDELYSDTPLAGFATEAAFFGKPAVVGSYYASQIHEVLRPEQMPPSLFIDPDQIEASIERLITDRAMREDLGRKALAFIREHWAAKRVAEKYLALIEGRVPRDWFFDPGSIRYREGCGLSREAAQAIIRPFLALGGRRALQLHDKPRLEELFLR